MNKSILGLVRQFSNVNISSLRGYAAAKGGVGGGKLGGGVSSNLFLFCLCSMVVSTNLY